MQGSANQFKYMRYIETSAMVLRKVHKVLRISFENVLSHELCAILYASSSIV